MYKCEGLVLLDLLLLFACCSFVAKFWSGHFDLPWAGLDLLDLLLLFACCSFVAKLSLIHI